MRFFGSASTVAALANMNVVVINLDFDNKWEVFRPDHPQVRYSQPTITTMHCSLSSAPWSQWHRRLRESHNRFPAHCDHRELWLVVSDMGSSGHAWTAGTHNTPLKGPSQQHRQSFESTHISPWNLGPIEHPWISKDKRIATEFSRLQPLHLSALAW